MGMDDDTTTNDDQGLGPKSGRVRIIGAEPAAQSLDPPPEGGPPDSGPVQPEEGSEAGAGSFETPPPEPELPHWTEAPTGEVPAVLARDRGDESDPWANVPGPTWREEHHDWTAAEDAFEPSMLAGDDDLRRGSLTESDTADSDRQPWTFDLTSPGPEDDEFTAGGVPASQIDRYPDDQTMVIPAVPSAATGEPLGVPAGQWEDPAPVIVPDVDDGVAATYALAPDEMTEPGIDPGPTEAPQPRGRRGRPGSTRPLRRRSRSAASDEAAVAADNPIDSLLGVSDPATTAAAAGAAGAAASSSGPIPVSSSSRSRTHPPARHHTPPPSDDDRSDRNMPLAVATGVVLEHLALVVFDLGTVLTMALATVLVVIAAAEAYAASRRGGYHPATLSALVATLSLMVATYNKGVEALPLVVVLLVAFSVLWFSWVEKADAVRKPGSPCSSSAGSPCSALTPPSCSTRRSSRTATGSPSCSAAVITAAAYDIGALFVGPVVRPAPPGPDHQPRTRPGRGPSAGPLPPSWPRSSSCTSSTRGPSARPSPSGWWWPWWRRWAISSNRCSSAAWA